MASKGHNNTEVRMPKEMKEIALDGFEAELSLETSPGGEMLDVLMTINVEAAWNGDDSTPVKLVKVEAGESLHIDCCGFVGTVFEAGAGLLNGISDDECVADAIKDAIQDEYATLYDMEEE